jgi:CheY-like chemotaxis protein
MVSTLYAHLIAALPSTSDCLDMTTNQRRRLLIVADNEQESGALVRLYESFGQKASATWSGRDALDYLASNRFDLLLVDQYVADMYAGEFIERVLKLPNHPRVVIMKSNGTSIPIQYDKSLGECQFLDKEQLARMHEVLLRESPESFDALIN